MRLMARISFAPASTATLSGVLSTTPPSRCSRLPILTEGNRPGIAVDARSGQGLRPLDQAPNVLLRKSAHLVPPQARDDDPERVRPEHVHRLA